MFFFFFFKQKTAYEMRISDWSSDVCSSDLLDTREDVQGRPIKLTIDGPLQDYAARRIGLESGSVVVIDCRNGALMCVASMPSFDPNSFSDGIGAIAYNMFRAAERVPLRQQENGRQTRRERGHT